MALRNAILASLGNGESSGYDLAKKFSGGVANLWTATSQQIYRELERMENDGLVEARTIEQTRRPNKRLFSVTEQGFEAMREFVASEPKPYAVRSELLVQVEMVDLTNLTDVRRNIEAFREQVLSKLQLYRGRREQILHGRSEAEFYADAKRIGPFLTLKRGIELEEGNSAWCDEVLEALRIRETAAQ